MRIAVLHFSHETVTFLKSDTTVDDFIYQGSPTSGEALLQSAPRSYIGGFVKVAREFPDVELVGIESPLFPKRGTASGWIVTEAFERFLGKMISELKAKGPFDGVYMSLHGAMGVRGVPKPEAEIARRVRAAVGRKAFIVGTFDPHANEDKEFLEAADMAFCVKYFPHYDEYLQGERAARTLVRAIRGDYKPATVTVKVPIATPTVMQWTGASPWMNLVQQALVWEAREPDVYVNVMFSFPWSDVPDIGITVQAMTNGNPELAKKVGDDIAAFAWRKRADLVKAAEIHLMPQGVALAKKAVEAGEKPVVLGDHSDRSGAATWLLGQVIEQDLGKTLIATLADEEACARLASAKVGDAFDMAVGGRLDESAGQPIRIKGTVKHVIETQSRRNGPGQRWIAVEFGRGNVVVLSPYLVQIMEVDTLRELGLDPDSFDVIAIKSRVHFRRGFDDNGFAKTIHLVEPIEPFLGTRRLEALPYKHVDLKQFYPYGNPTFP
ncbi:MAG: M81 family metallopeptidase [Alphaproteobacteria bacterium]|nr:M81 family metallopeptidase [Alphaproteobacteria bacterium]